MTTNTPGASEPDALLTLDLSSVAPASRFTRAVLGILLAVVFGALALACAVLYFGYDFIPALEGWEFVAEWVAPVVGVLAAGVALLGLEFVRRSRKNAASGPTVFDTASELIDSVVPGDDEPDPLTVVTKPAPRAVL